MAEPTFTIKFEGGDADNHLIDMRQLGESLQGIDRIISAGLIAIVNQRVPKKGERAPLILKTREPKPGSWVVEAILQDYGWVLGLGIPLLSACGQDLIVDWMKSVIYYYTGRRDKAEDGMQSLANMSAAHLIARDRSEERHHEAQMKTLDILHDTIRNLGAPAAQAASTVGRSARRLRLLAGPDKEVEIDEPTAERLREQEEESVGALQAFVLRTDGFISHTGKLSVEHPERPGAFLLAEVKDPLFEEEGNPYTLAAHKKALIKVQAKPGYKDGRLERLYIMDFEGEVEDAA